MELGQACIEQLRTAYASRIVVVILHRAALGGRSLPVVQGCGWAWPCGRQTSQSALAASVASRYALGADGVCGRCAPGRLHMCPPPITRALPLGGCRCRRRRALCADREARCTRRFALLPSARVGRGVSDIIMHKRAGERLRATAACAVRVGAARLCNRSALPPGQADPPHFERARVAARRLRGAS